MVIEVTVGSDGKVTSTRCVSTSALAVDLAVCVLGQVRTWTFHRKPGEPFVLRYPLVFRAE